MDKTCLACGRKLKPQTSVPRWPESYMEHEHNRKFYEEQKAQRARELEEGKLGYLGEAHFCGQPCAAFFGRATVHFINNSDQYGPFVLKAVQKILKLYTWIINRTKEKV